MDSGLRRGWGEFLEPFPWQWWGTLTFREEYSSDAADRAFGRFAGWLQNDSPGVGYFVGHEIGKLGREHLHFLAGGLRPWVSRRVAWKRWFDRHGRAQIIPYDPELGAAHYISKYVTKDFSRYDIQEPRPWVNGEIPDLWRTVPVYPELNN